MEQMSAAERLQVEVELLQAMYPEQINFDPKSLELKYLSPNGGTLVLRIPEFYPEKGLPDLISATDASKNDVRIKANSSINEMRLLPGEEVLDAIVQNTEAILDQCSPSSDVNSPSRQKAQSTDRSTTTTKAVIVWLHHLLNTNKRKLALNPTRARHSTVADNGIVSGITKPGYPGILLYSGPSYLVDAHVAELKQQRWQAFHVRYSQEFDDGVDDQKIWTFEHGDGIIEVESMADVVQDIIGDDHKEAFLKATGVK